MNWDLTKLYADFDDPRLREDWAKAESLIDDMGALLDRASAGERARETLEDLIRGLKSLQTLLTMIGHLIFLTLSVDARNEQALGLHERFSVLSNRMKPILSRAARYVDGICDLEGLCARSALLSEHAYVLGQLKRQARHAIDPALEETVLSLQLTGGRAWEQLRDMLDATHLVPIARAGQEERLPLSVVRGMANSADAAVRKSAYEAELASYAAIEVPMAACLSAIKGEALTMARLKHHDSVLDWVLCEAHMDRETLAAMLTAMRESLPIFRKYLRAKAKALGHANGLPFYDLFAPLGQAGASHTLSEAREMLVRVLGGFSPRMGEMVGRAFDEHWIDAQPRPGKQGGAFCAGIHPLGISYVLANFEGSLASVSTLAHELGHAYHNECLREKSILNADYPMPLAETASIFNETLLMQTLLERAQGEERMGLLDQELSDSTQVIVDILSRYLFETEVLERRADRVLSAKELCAIMLDAQEQAYGDGLDPDFRHPYMWACKSHYYSADMHFYNFPYAFGLLFGKGVYALYEARGASFVSDYDALLAATAIGDVAEVAASVGIDVRSVEFWRGSLRVIGEAIEQFVQMVR